jgi:hypothetical protein
MTPVQRAILLLGRRSTAASVDADAQAWADAVTLAGGTYSAGDLTAMSAFITAAKANGYWTKLTCFGPLMGGQLTAALVQYKSGVWAPATNVNFVSGDYTRATGLTGNGTTKYLNTGFIPSVSNTLNDTHLAAYVRSSTAANGGTAIGALNSTGQMLALNFPFSDGVAYSDQYNISNGRISVPALTAPFGFGVGSRLAAANHAVYRNGASIGTSATATALGTLPNVALFVCALNNNGGGATQFAATPIGMYSGGPGLTGTDATNYNTDIQTLMTALGRNV